MKKIVLLSIFTFLFLQLNAQYSTKELTKTGVFNGAYSSSAGQVFINQNPDLQMIVNNHISINKDKYVIKGWRVQVYLGSGKNAGSRANAKKTSFLSRYPNINAYLVYDAPYFKIQVGNFRTKLQAEAFKKKISKHFSKSWVVESEIQKPD